MKRQNNKLAGIILIIPCSLALCFMVAMFFVTANLIKGNGFFAFMYLPMAFMTLVIIALLVLGIRMIIAGKKAEAIQRNGKKSTCEIFNILRVQHGYQMIVIYKGESGNEYRQSVGINYQAAASFKPGMIIECYISGEDCYVDGLHVTGANAQNQ